MRGFHGNGHGKQDLHESPGMNKEKTAPGSALFGDPGQIGVSRGLGEFHGRRPVIVTAPGEALLALPVEGLDGQRLAEFSALCAPAAPALIITERRAFALGLNATTPVAVPLSAGHDAAAIVALVTAAVSDRMRQQSPRAGLPLRPFNWPSCRTCFRPFLRRTSPVASSPVRIRSFRLMQMPSPVLPMTLLAPW